MVNDMIIGLLYDFVFSRCVVAPAGARQFQDSDFCVQANTIHWGGGRPTGNGGVQERILTIYIYIYICIYLCLLGHVPNRPFGIS